MEKITIDGTMSNTDYSVIKQSFEAGMEKHHNAFPTAPIQKFELDDIVRIRISVTDCSKQNVKSLYFCFSNIGFDLTISKEA
ncbi:hypothetical protein NVP2275O_110 [Vibrio phage 2.275.O._10N.286.54.E11]|nr:hypothetical protein NVP2275O_110 [Vibrio phage 2.275.O._10N.286.54.E11]